MHGDSNQISRPRYSVDELVAVQGRNGKDSSIEAPALRAPSPALLSDPLLPPTGRREKRQDNFGAYPSPGEGGGGQGSGKGQGGGSGAGEPLIIPPSRGGAMIAEIIPDIKSALTEADSRWFSPVFTE